MTRATDTSRRPATAASVCWLLLLAGGWLTLRAHEVGAQPAPSKEYQVKAACLLNFAQFIEWPAAAFAEPKSPIVVGVLGEDPFGTLLEQAFEDELIDGHKLVVKRSAQVEDMKACHLLFISRSETDRLSGILESLINVSVVTVGEMDEFIQHGGIIKFNIEDKRVRFEINVGAAKRKAIKINSQLLKRARIVG